MQEAMEKMVSKKGAHFLPEPKRHEIFRKLFQEYSRLHDYFGYGGNAVMERLKQLKSESARLNGGLQYASDKK